MSKQQKTRTPPVPPDIEGEIRVSRTRKTKGEKRERALAGLEEMLERPGMPSDAEGKRQGADEKSRQRRVIRRQVREIPAESNVWFAIGLAAIGIAAAAALTAATVVDSPITKAILWTVAACVALAGASYFAVHLDINRGRRVKRSEVVEEYEEEV